MKKAMIFLFFHFITVGIYAQGDTGTTDADTRSYSNEIGLNVTTFIQNILGFSASNIDNDSPYLLTYKYHFNRKALRFGIGGVFSSSDEEDSSNAGTLKVDEYQVDFRAGFEFQSSLSEKWVFYGGIDAIVELSSLKTVADQDFDKVTTENNAFGIGGGPVVGIQFNINPRLNISTDASLYFLSMDETRKVHSVNFPEFNSKNTENSSSLRFTVPFSIFMKFRL